MEKAKKGTSFTFLKGARITLDIQAYPLANQHIVIEFPIFSGKYFSK